MNTSERNQLIELLKSQYERGNIYNIPSLAGEYPELNSAVRMRPDQRLCISLYNVLGSGSRYQGNLLPTPTFNISALFIAVDGTIVPINDQVVTWNTMKTVKLGDGFLLWVTVLQFQPATWFPRTYASISIRPDRGDAPAPYAFAPRWILSEGWIGQGNGLSYPSQKADLGLDERVQVLCFDDPANGSDFVWQTSSPGLSPGLMEILQVRFQLTTSAVVATRRAGALLLCTDNIPAGAYQDRTTGGSMSQTTQGASLTRIYIFQQNGLLYSANTIDQVGVWTATVFENLPSPFSFMTGQTEPGSHTQFRIPVENMDQDDQLSKIFITYRYGKPLQALT